MITDEYKRLKNEITAALADVHRYINDDSVPLEDRWDVFVQVEKDLPTNQFFCRLPGINGISISLYDDLNIDRHSMIQFSELIDMIDDTEFSMYEGYNDYINNLKEYIIREGFGSFIYDW